jgi:hypothetical protein
MLFKCHFLSHPPLFIKHPLSLAIIADSGFDLDAGNCVGSSSTGLLKINEIIA